MASIAAAIKDEDDETADDDSDAETVVSDGKLWKPRRTLRKYAHFTRIPDVPSLID